MLPRQFNWLQQRQLKDRHRVRLGVRRLAAIHHKSAPRPGAGAEANTPGERLRSLLRVDIDFALEHPADYQLSFSVGPDVLSPIKKGFARRFEEQEPGRAASCAFAIIFSRRDPPVSSAIWIRWSPRRSCDSSATARCRC